MPKHRACQSNITVNFVAHEMSHTSSGISTLDLISNLFILTSELQKLL